MLSQTALTRTAQFLTAVMGNDREALAELRALDGATSAAGGYIMPEGFIAEVNALASAAQLPLHMVPLGSSIVSRTVIRTIPDVSFVPGSQPSTDQGIVFDSVKYHAGRLEAYFDVSDELIGDAPGLVDRLRVALAPAFAAGRNRYAINGSGNDEPEGVLTHGDVPTQAATNTDAEAVAASIEASVEKLPAGARIGASCAVAMNGAAFRKLRNLGRALNEPIIQYHLAPSGVLIPYVGAFRVVVTGAVATAANLTELVFGSWELGYGWAVKRPLAVATALGGRDEWSVAMRVYELADGKVEQPTAFVRLTGLDVS